MDAAGLVSEFLSRESARVARAMVRHERASLPDEAGVSTRRLVRQYKARMIELARLLDTHGLRGVSLFGEKLRPRAAELVALDLPLRVLLDEQTAFHLALVNVWMDGGRPMPDDVVRLLDELLAEAMFHTADVWVRRRRIAGEAFQEAALLQIVVEALDEAIVVFEADGTVSFVTAALTEVAGVDPRQVVGVPFDELLQTISLLQLREPSGKTLPTDRLPWSKTLLSGQPVHEETVFIRRLDNGRHAVVEVFATPVKNEDGRLRGAIVTLRDRTERHRIFLELEQAYSDLRRMHERLLSRSHLETVGGLVRGAVHALNNHLNVLMMRARHLVDEPGHEGDHEAMLVAGREMAEVLARLQDFALPPNERPVTAVSLADAVREMRALTHSEFGPGSPVRLDVKLPELPRVQAQRETLVELLTSLVLLARDLATGGHRLHLEAHRAGDRVEVVMRAGGRRVPTPPTVPDDFSGESRLTLPLARELVERWGGRLEVGDVSNTGRLVSLTLSVAPELQETIESAAAPPSPPRTTARTVLVVDDDHDNAEVLSEVLAEAGLEARMAFNGTQALREVDEEVPDVVLLDLHLPDMEGWEVARQLRDRHPGVRIGVVSGLATPGAPEEREVEAVFRKPVDASVLVDFVTH